MTIFTFSPVSLSTDRSVEWHWLLWQLSIWQGQGQRYRGGCC